MLVYPSAIDLSSAHVRHLAQRLAAHRREIGTRWRRVTPGRQALLVLAHLRCGDTYAQLSAGFGVGIATVYRYVREAVQVLATTAPSLADAVRAASRLAFVILDGTLLPIDRITADTPYYFGKHKRHGMNVQVLMEAPAQQHARQDPLPRRAGHGHAEGLATPAEDPLQHQPHHRPAQGRPRPSVRISVRLEKAH